MRKPLGFAILLLFSAAHSTQGQVQRSGRGDPRLEPKLEAALAAQPRVIAQDTFIARGDTVRGPVLFLRHRLVLEGTILGDLTIVDANVYVRPTARITGNVLNIGSGLYRSELATISGRVDDHPLAPYHVEREDGRLTIVGDVDYKALGLMMLAPTADRVNGFRPRAGITLESPPFGRMALEADVWGAYGFERDDFEQRLQGGAEARLLRGFNSIGVGYEQTTDTNDEWIRSDLRNLISYLWNGKDYRNYYEAERLYLHVARDLIRGGHDPVASLRLQREDASPLIAGSPWSLLKPDSVRHNPVVPASTIKSATLSLNGEWKGLSSLASYESAFEVGSIDLWNDGSFRLISVWGEYAMRALANHTLELETRVQLPLSDSLPRQRWGMMGGSNTLYTFEVGEFWGDRLLFLGSKYRIPVDRVRLPVLGTPSFDLLHTIGKAWSKGQSGALEQNIGARIQFPMGYVRFMANPADLSERKFAAGVSIPKARYPWQRPPERE